MKPEMKIQTILPALDAMSPVAFAKTRTERMLGEELNEFAVDKNGWTHLHWAAAANDAPSALRLLKLGALLDSKNNGGADFGPEVKHRFAVLGLGDVEWDEMGETPLGVAMRVRAFSAASVLIAHGANVYALNGARGVFTPLHWAAMHNAPEVAELLISNGADVNAKDGGGDTPLYQAAMHNAPEVAELLISNGADVNAKGMDVTPLHQAARQNAPKVAELLISNGADVNAKDRGHDTPLHEAACSDARHVAELLISNGANVNALKSDGALLHYAATYNATKVAEVLINAGADVNEGYGVFMPLHKAAGANAPEVAEVLINSGANVNAKDKFGRTPLHWAAEDNAPEVAELLISNGADVNAKDRPGRTPLHWAEMGMRRATEVVTMLISNGAIVDAKDNSGRAPSDYAAFRVRGINKMRPDGLLFAVLCCLHARPELGLLLADSPPLLGTEGEAAPVESVLSRLRFHELEVGDSTWDVEAWLAQDGFWGVVRQVQDSRRYVDGGADPEEDFHRALRALERRHAEKTGAGKSAWLEKIRHDAEEDYEIPPLS